MSTAVEDPYVLKVRPHCGHSPSGAPEMLPSSRVPRNGGQVTQVEQ